MYRLLVFACLALCSGLANGQSFPCRRRQINYNGNIGQYHEQLFNDLAQKVMELDNKIKTACNQNSNAATKEKVERNRYVIEIPLSGYSATGLNIKIKQRVIEIKAKNGDKEYKQLRILPNFLDTAGGAYTLEDDVLEIAFPFLKGANNCILGYDNTEIKVPEFNLFGNGQNRPRSGGFN